jgi:hypothetical protein
MISKFGIEYTETSALTGMNVRETIIKDVIQAVADSNEEELDKTDFFKHRNRYYRRTITSRLAEATKNIKNNLFSLLKRFYPYLAFLVSVAKFTWAHVLYPLFVLTFLISILMMLASFFFRSVLFSVVWEDTTTEFKLKLTNRNSF